jgi:predicted nucleic acid-binding protein
VTRYVIDSGTTLELAGAATEVSPDAELYAPTLWRSETLSAMFEAVRRGDVAEEVARERIAYVNALKIRLLGDAVLRRRAWELARELDMQTTYQAEYVALAQLQKCVLVTADDELERRVAGLVPTATIDALS